MSVSKSVSQSVSQSVRDFTVVGGQLAHLTKLRFSANKTDKTGNIDKQNHRQKSVGICHHVWEVHKFATNKSLVA